MVCFLTEETDSGIGSGTIVAITLSLLTLSAIVLLFCFLMCIKTKKKVIPASASKVVVQKGVVQKRSSEFNVNSGEAQMTSNMKSQGLDQKPLPLKVSFDQVPKAPEREIQSLGFKPLPGLRSNRSNRQRGQQIPPLGHQNPLSRGNLSSSQGILNEGTLKSQDTKQIEAVSSSKDSFSQ